MGGHAASLTFIHFVEASQWAKQKHELLPLCFVGCPLAMHLISLTCGSGKQSATHLKDTYKTYVEQLNLLIEAYTASVSDLTDVQKKLLQKQIVEPRSVEQHLVS